MTAMLMARLRFLTWPVVLLSVLIGAGVGTALGFLSIPRTVVVVQEIHEVNGMVVRGGWIDLSFTLTRNRDCPSRVERWLWHWTGEGDSRIKRWVQVDANGANPPTELNTPVTYVLAMPIPGGVAAGEWFYRSRTRDLCPWTWTSMFRGDVIRESPDIPIPVREPTAQSPVQVVTQPAPVLILPDAPPK